jgi:hypothetical protein
MFLQGGEWLEDIQFGSGSANRIDWSKAVSRAPITRFFHDLMNVRLGNCGFRSNAGYQVYHVDDTNNVIAFHRWCDNGNDLVIVASFNNNDLYNYQIGFPQAGTWYELLNSQASVYLGNGLGNGGSVTAVNTAFGAMPDSAWITIPQMGLLVFRYNQPPFLTGDLNCDGAVNFGDINPFVLYLSNFASWQTTYSGCNPQNGDINGDGTYPAFSDINPFVTLLSGGG